MSVRAGLIAAAVMAVSLAGTACRREPASQPVPAKPMVLLVTIDTLRADHLGCYGYFRDTSPVIDRFADEAILFENAYCPMATTLPSHTSIFTGVYPLEHGVVANVEHGGLAFGFKPGLQTVTPFFKQAGYTTGAFVSSAPLWSFGGLDVGFDIYHQPRGQELPAGQTTDAVLKWLDEHAHDAVFLWVHYFDPHWPRNPPPPFDEMFQTDDALEAYLAERAFPDEVPASDCHPDHTITRQAHNRYDGEVRYADQQLGRVFDKLRELGRYDDAIIVIAADHGEGLNQHNWPAHGRNWDEQVRVPLLMRFPHPDPSWPKRFAPLVSLLDIFPTVLARMDAPWAAPFLVQTTGVDVLDPGYRPRPLFVQRTGRDCGAMVGPMYALVTPQYTYHLEPKEGDKLFDRTADPYELDNAIARRPGVAGDLRDKLLAMKAKLDARGDAFGAAQSKAVGEETQKALEALGYIKKAMKGDSETQPATNSTTAPQ